MKFIVHLEMWMDVGALSQYDAECAVIAEAEACGGYDVQVIEIETTNHEN